MASRMQRRVTERPAVAGGCGVSRRRCLGMLAASAALPVDAGAQTDPVADALRRVDGASLIAIGERHDNPEHHALQAELVRRLKPRGIAFEMIPRALEGRVNELRLRGVSRAELGKALDWENSGWPDWDLYAPILEAAPQAYIAGGGLSRETLNAIYRDGPAALGDAFVERYRLDDAMPEAVMAAMLEAQFTGHCGMIGRAKLAPMVTIQRVWDASYADALLRAAERGGGKAVLICGNAHARLDYGAPHYLRAAGAGGVASIGMLEGDEMAEEGAYSVTLSADAPVRDDPCAALREHLAPE